MEMCHGRHQRPAFLQPHLPFFHALLPLTLYEMETLSNRKIEDELASQERISEASNGVKSLDTSHSAQPYEEADVCQDSRVAPTVDTTKNLIRRTASVESLASESSLAPPDQRLHEIHEICESCQSIDLSRADPERPEETYITVDLTNYKPSPDGCQTCRFFVDFLERTQNCSRPITAYLMPFRTANLYWSQFSYDSAPRVSEETVSFVLCRNIESIYSIQDCAYRWGSVTPSVLSQDPYQPFRHANLGKKANFGRVRLFLDFCEENHTECNRQVVARPVSQFALLTARINALYGSKVGKKGYVENM